MAVDGDHYVRRWSRLREIAAVDVRRVIIEAVEDGWTPAGWHGNPSWRELAAFARLSDDVALLTKCVDAVRDACPSHAIADRDHRPSWFARRADAVGALAENPQTPRLKLTQLLPKLDETAVLAMLRNRDGMLRQPCLDQLERLRQAERDNRPKGARRGTAREKAKQKDDLPLLAGRPCPCVQ